MKYIIFNTSEIDQKKFINTPIILNSQQMYVLLTADEQPFYEDYAPLSERQVKVILRDIQDKDGNRTDKLYLTRLFANEDPNAFNIFLQDYFALVGNPLAEMVFNRALTYNDNTFSQWFGILNMEGRFFRAIVGSFAIALKGIPTGAGGITETQRQELDYILRDFMNDVYTGNWRTAAEFYYLGYPSLLVPSIRSQLPLNLLPTFALLEAQLDAYIARFYTDTNGNPLIINPNMADPATFLTSLGL